jgi:hypothetical protein
LFLVLPSAQQTLRNPLRFRPFSQGTALQGRRYHCKRGTTEANMPILLWLLGVPLSLIVVLMLFGAF